MRIQSKRFARMLAAALVLMMVFSGTAFAYSMPYKIKVDLTNQIVTVYNSSDGSIARQMLCSSGSSGPTCKGTFYLPRSSNKDMRNDHYYFFDFYGSYAKWATRIDGGILFHSICYDKPNENGIDLSTIKRFGHPASHGCVRLRVEDAQFIAEKCKPGTMTQIAYSGKPNEELRTLLYHSSYTGGISYDRFCGITNAEDEIGVGATGDRVSDLQARLKDLGYFTGMVSGTYDVETVVAVKRMQRRLGMTEDGIYRTELDRLLFSGDMPLGTYLTLQGGSVGLAVRRLQNALTEMCMYTGPIDEIYDDEVAEAVKKFQHVNFFSEDGIASPIVQAGIYYHQAEMRKVFDELSDLTFEAASEQIKVGVVSAQGARRLRAKPNTDSKTVGKVSTGDALLIAGKKNGWYAVWSSEAGGYIYAGNVKAGNRDNTVLTYSKPGVDRTYQMGCTMTEYNTGKKSFAVSFDRYYTIQEFFYKDTIQRQYVSIATGEAGVSLNLRSEPNGESEILDQIPDGERLEVLAANGDWTLVCWNGQAGYLMNEYLSPEIEEEEKLDDSIRTEEKAEVLVMATVVSVDGSGDAPVYDENAKRLGTLREGTQVEILLASEDYEAALIRVKGHEGYMRLENLQSTTDDEADAESESVSETEEEPMEEPVEEPAAEAQAVEPDQPQTDASNAESIEEQ